MSLPYLLLQQRLKPLQNLLPHEMPLLTYLMIRHDPILPAAAYTNMQSPRPSHLLPIPHRNELLLPAPLLPVILTNQDGQTFRQVLGPCTVTVLVQMVTPTPTLAV